MSYTPAEAAACGGPSALYGAMFVARLSFDLIVREQVTKVAGRRPRRRRLVRVEAASTTALWLCERATRLGLAARA